MPRRRGQTKKKTVESEVLDTKVNEVAQVTQKQALQMVTEDLEAQGMSIYIYIYIIIRKMQNESNLTLMSPLTLAHHFSYIYAYI